MAITNGYTTLASVKAALRITDSTDDTLIEGSVDAASRMIDGYTMRNFYQSGTVSRLFTAYQSYMIPVDDLAGTAVTIQTSSRADGVFDVTFAASDYQLEPLNGSLDGIPWAYDRIRAVGDYIFPTQNAVYAEEALVKITGVFGWPAVPNAVVTACLLQAMRIFKRYDAPLGVAGFGDFGAVRVSRYLDPDVEQLLAPYRKMRNIV